MSTETMQGVFFVSSPIIFNLAGAAFGMWPPIWHALGL